MSDLPEPLTPPNCDLRDFQFLPLDVVRLRDSGLSARATGDEFRAAVLLWCASWHQIPAASLPDDDIDLASLCGYGRALKDWKKLKAGALRGWIKCSDGRLYHETVAEKAREAWQSKLQQRWKTECARIRKHNERNKTNFQTPEFEEWVSRGCQPAKLTSVTSDTQLMSQGQEQNVTRDNPDVSHEKTCETASKGQGQGQGQGIKEEVVALGTDGDRARPPPAAASSDPFPRYANPPGKPPMPCRGDPPDAWKHLAPLEADGDGPRRAAAGGYFLDTAAELVCEAAQIRDERWRGDWRPLIAWLTAGIDLHAVIIPAIRQVAARPNYRVPASLQYFDRAVRQSHASAAA